MIKLPHVYQTHRAIKPYIRHTLLLQSPYLSEQSGADVWLKLENQQPTGSFKVRGALSKIGRLSEQEKARGIVAASAGNHALGVAHAVGSLGDVQADIFLPTTAPAAKVEKLRRFPVTLHFAGETYASAHHAAEEFRVANNAVEISAYDDPDVILGQATVGVEILTELPRTEVILVPVGGGGLIAGITAVSHQINPDCQIVGMQPTASPAALLSLQDGVAHEEYDHEPTIADGLAGGFGKLPFETIRSFPPQIQLASESDMRRAIFTLLDTHQLIVEPSGAISIAPLLQPNPELAGKTVVCVLTGGNLDTNLLRDIVNNQGACVK